MSKEIERKFLVKEMPDVVGLHRSRLERYFLYIGEGIELRIQTNGNWYKLQRKSSVSETERDTEEIKLSAAEFEQLKKIAISSIQRESYHLADSPKTDIRMYGGIFDGLVRVEFEFISQEELATFTPPNWVGAEITGTSLARDSQLLALDQNEFQLLLEKYQAQNK